MTAVRNYWDDRYSCGGNSGAGSEGGLADFKIETLNEFIRDRQIKSVLDLGCGDGRIAKGLIVPVYTGFDISDHALRVCRSHCYTHINKVFLPMMLCSNHNADLGISLDVVFHLTDDSEYHSYMWHLFRCSRDFVAIYSSNDETWNKTVSQHANHIRHWNFTKWVEEFAPDWDLMHFVKNPYPFNGSHKEESFSDFYFYKRGTSWKKSKQ